jgi:HEAT repeat protein
VDKIVIYKTVRGSKRFSIMSDKERDMLASVTADVEVLDALSYDDMSNVRFAVAYNNMASEATLERLSHDDDGRTRFWVAKNPNVSSDVLRQLLKDPDKSVRWQAAQHLKERR